jgi:hypothetical protein
MSLGHTWVCCILFLTCQLPCQAKRKALLHYMAAELSVEQLKQLQYYSNGFDLVRRVTDTHESSTAGKLITRNGQAYEIIRFRQGTPGLVTEVSENRNWISVSFEPNCSIMFRRRDDSDKESSFAVASQRIFGPGGESKKNEIEYCGKSYFLEQEHTTAGRFYPKGQVAMRDAGLLLIVDEKKIHDVTKDKRSVPGQRIDKH